MQKTKRFFTVILSITTAILTIAVVVLTCLLIKNAPPAPPTPHQQYYNNKCNTYQTENYYYAKGQIVFIGDSITDLYVLDEHYADLPLATYNRGIGGDTTKGVLNRLQVSIFDIKPSKIVLLIGTNDINGGESNADILTRYTEIVQTIRSTLPNAELYCTSIIPQNDDLETYSSINVATTTEKILQLNPAIAEIARTNGATFINLFPLLADENNRLIKAYSDDGLHLNYAGLTVWTNLLKPYLQS